MNTTRQYSLSITTQGPTYPPSEVMDANSDFIVIGRLNLEKENKFYQKWDAAIVSKDTPVPEFGQNVPYKINRYIQLDNLGADAELVLYTLSLPLPCNNYPMVFAPEQKPAFTGARASYPFHQAPIPDLRIEDGRKLTQPITLADWIKAKGELTVKIVDNEKAALFEFEFQHLIPDSLYTIMALRENDLNPKKLTRPGPLGVPNVFITDDLGRATYKAKMPNPFMSEATADRNRIINVVVLWMSTQMSYGGAIGHYGLGGDIHAQLKLQVPSFMEFNTKS